MTRKAASDFFNEAYVAPPKEKPGLLLQFCRAAIKAREHGEMELWEVGTKTLTLAGQIDQPSVTLGKLNAHDAIVEELYAVAGRLDLADQGGTTAEDDERAWNQYKKLVDEYENSLRNS